MSMDHYLDVHFRLLREDFLSPLREGIREFLKREPWNRKKKYDDIRLYENAKIVESVCNANGVSYTIQFDTKHFSKVKWEHSRRLIFGSLLCLSSDDFKTALFACVSDSKPEELKKGMVTVKFEDALGVMKELTQAQRDATYIIAESQAYFEAYKHILKALQTCNADNLPLQQFLINVSTNNEMPRYLNKDSVYDFECLLKDNVSPKFVIENSDGNDDRNERAVPSEKSEKSTMRHVGDIDEWHSTEELNLDESQRRALHMALSSSLAIIQGPPGTGKTHLGLKIMRLLLSNVSTWKKADECSPILVVCLTNHALDQFLEGMIGFTTSIVRVGGRSENKALEKFNLKNIMRQQTSANWQQTSANWKRRSPMEYRVKAIRDEVTILARKIYQSKEYTALLNKNILFEGKLEREMSSDWEEEQVRSVTSGFRDYYGVQPMKEIHEWYPDSFLAVWLGLTYDDSLIHDDVLQHFYEDDQFSDMQIMKNQEQIDYIPDEEEKGLIQVDDLRTRINRGRILDFDEEIEDFKVVEPLFSPNGIWSVIIENLDQPEYPKKGNCYYKERLFKWLKQRGKLCKKIAQREIKKIKFMNEKEANQIKNVWRLDLVDRWRLYRRWVNQQKMLTEQSIITLQKEYEETAKMCRETNNAFELSVLRKKNIVGMTTTGAAKHLEALRELQPKIVIVEEAAEVLESHIITALSSSIQHLILIGDHKQLRPTVNVFKLVKQFHLDISLFERMIKNNYPHETLQLQHRMRPEISSLLVPHIYKDLKDHKSVDNYPRVKGTVSNVFFLNHNNPEEEVGDLKTHSNPFEAEFLVELCHYFLQQGYKKTQITILTTYTGQLFTLRKLMPKLLFDGVRVTAVDNFQGEENDIILLSFVRSNEEGKIGFLSIYNRVNVALSRAKIGLFCVGNFEFFAKKSRLWGNILEYLKKNSLIGDKMQLKCQKHEVITQVSNAQDFKLFAPEGSCLQQCEEKLKCGHVCERKCHLTSHGNCMEDCEKIICELGHRCPLKCYVLCEPCKKPVLKKHPNCEHRKTVPCNVDISKVRCKVKVERLLKCEHEVELQCHIDPDNYGCIMKIFKKLPLCGHEVIAYCYLDPAEVPCDKKCEYRLDCGHVCPQLCHTAVDNAHEEIKCFRCCERACKNGHKCKKLCSEPCGDCLKIIKKVRPCGHELMHPCGKEMVINDKCFIMGTLQSGEINSCHENCTKALPCGHPCGLLCFKTCGDCQVKVKKTLSCGHTLRAYCNRPIESIICPYPCKKTLNCGHKCTNKCGETCQNLCVEMCNKEGKCGHNISIQCHLTDPWKITKQCAYPCSKILPCDHQCKGTCGDCRQGRLHVRCSSRCGRTQICGHTCNFPCAAICPPCSKACPTKCGHSKCPKQCGRPCCNCKELCLWKCRHHVCFRQCYELCERPRCDIPCERRLQCGHACVGLCGEKCPRLCRVCHREELTEILFGNEEDKDARFIQLDDCKHCIEVKGLDQWMDEDQNDVQMKGCPKCKTTIWTSNRYGNVIKKRMHS